ncbi:hypothetical protein FZC79_00865 [Rossellomorea vietnamensis]|uniref:Phospholipid phosphatase n=1 Tax=Rossellomorea vietnamensis TaxID=218284 RepID=A0A5D4KKZ4_9BACI|nr:hypothetical protein [Rossellomorea vietnamensis]TYR77405.1 hypothetical protein FZC79_00865 [Rossellomorea vietnamensis]
MDTILFGLFAAAYIGLAIWTIKIYKTERVISAAFLVPVILGLVYDNSIIAAGRFIGEGSFLQFLNALRYWYHAFFTPLLVLFSWKTLEQANISWAKTKWLRWAAYLLTAALVLLELFTEVFGMELEAAWDYGVLTYSNTASSGGPPIMVLAVSVVLLAASIIIWSKKKWIWFFLGSLVMAAGSAVQLPIESGAITNLFELALLSSLAATAYFQRNREEV